MRFWLQGLAVFVVILIAAAFAIAVWGRFKTDRYSTTLE
jgi:hypothetical protein